MDKFREALDMESGYLATWGIPEEAMKDINSSVLESGLWKIVDAVGGKNWEMTSKHTGRRTRSAIPERLL